MKAVSGTWNFSGHRQRWYMDVTARRNLNMDVNLRRLPGKNNILIKILSAAYNFYVAFLFEEP